MSIDVSAAVPVKVRFTVEQYFEVDPPEHSSELVRGEIIEVPPPHWDHGVVAGRVYFALEFYGRQTGFGYALGTDTALVTQRDPDTVRGVDVMFYSQARYPLRPGMPKLPELPPDLAVEVVSPSNLRAEILQKVAEYLDLGVPMVWVVHPKRRSVGIYRPGDPYPTMLGEADTLEDLPELPGFRCPVADLFP